MSDGRHRDDAGRFVASRSRSDLLEAMNPREPYTTGELADLLGWPRRTVYHYLAELENDDRVRKKKPSERQAIWILQAGEAEA